MYGALPLVALSKWMLYRGGCPSHSDLALYIEVNCRDLLMECFRAYILYIKFRGLVWLLAQNIFGPQSVITCYIYQQCSLQSTLYLVCVYVSTSILCSLIMACMAWRLPAQHIQPVGLQWYILCMYKYIPFGGISVLLVMIMQSVELPDIIIYYIVRSKDAFKMCFDVAC